MHCVGVSFSQVASRDERMLSAASAQWDLAVSRHQYGDMVCTVTAMSTFLFETHEASEKWPFRLAVVCERLNQAWEAELA